MTATNFPFHISTHSTQVSALRQRLLEWRLSRRAGDRLALKRRGGFESSNTLRNASYKAGLSTLDVSNFNRVLRLDPDAWEITVEPGVTMDVLLDACLSADLFPAVLPEFCKLTVGGLIQGAGIESGSFRHGQFNDQATAHEVLFGNGDVVRLTPGGAHTDLFHGISGSFGTLVILLSTTLRLVPAASHVEIQYERCDSLEGVVARLSACTADPDTDFLCGIVLSPTHAVVVRGRLTNWPRRSRRLRSYGSRWFFEHAGRVTRDSAVHKEYVPLRDYLFRYDQGAFWMGSYVRWKGIGIGRMSAVRRILHPMFTTEALYRKLHSISEDDLLKRFIIQDCYIPAARAAGFLKTVDELASIYPLWLCPIRTTQDPQKLSPHYLEAPMCLNVGIYGRPRQGSFDARSLNRDLEARVAAHDGRKMLYAHAWYTPDEFWALHDRAWYDGLRAAYGADDLFLRIEEKVLRPTRV